MLHLSALIVTHNRSDWLERCILSLRAAALACPLVELKIAVGLNGEDTASAQVLEKFQSSHKDLALEYRTLVKTTPAAARNQVLPHTDGEWILYIDDDAFVETEFFKAFCASVRAFPGAGAIGGPNLTHPGASHFQRTLGEVLSHRFATFTSVARYRPAPVGLCDDSSLMLCNLFVRIELARALHFPERLICAEENWLLTRVQRLGKSMVYDPGLWAWHERRQNLRQLVRQVFCYGQGRGQQLRIQTSALRLPHLLPSICLLYALGAFAFSLVGLLPAIALLLPFGGYLLLCLVFSIKAWRPSPLAAVLFPAIHVSYALGVLMGLRPWQNSFKPCDGDSKTQALHQLG